MLTKRKIIGASALWAVWLATRIYLYLLATAPGGDGDVGIYQWWYACCFAHGTFPLADSMWQYPPGAGLVLWLPGWLPGGYVHDFVFGAIACDLGITLMLIARARRGGSVTGAWYWVCGVPLLGAVTIVRFDIVPVALSVAAVCVTGRGVTRGLLAGAGAAVKAWPVTLLAGMAPGQFRRGVAAAVAVLAVACVLFGSETASFLAHQNDRGVEIESVAATPFMIWRQAGWPGTAVFRFGAYQLSGPHTALARDASRLGLVLVIAAVLGWQLLIVSGRGRWRPEFAADAPLAATLLFLVASPVLSTQYLLWVTGLAAACLAVGRTTQRPVALAVLAAAGLTRLIFPDGWLGLVHGSDLVTGVLVARNTLLVAAAVLSCRRITSATWPRPRRSSSGAAHRGQRDSHRRVTIGWRCRSPLRPARRATRATCSSSRGRTGSTPGRPILLTPATWTGRPSTTPTGTTSVGGGAVFPRRATPGHHGTHWHHRTPNKTATISQQGMVRLPGRIAGG